ncbi:antitoxin [Leucobacter sp. cx-328]|uniref:Rv0909 family putative TA system antitoxin n=1 Tax=unclassified Leucobacter TaxID=2621730 RepID=UPI00165DBB07|nr:MULTISPECIES: Rv0909 family putative TA system antitoxin [unclassified Leucobacter]MBC9945165.1 antitoxin [Leucobacter sp. cx-328]
MANEDLGKQAADAAEKAKTFLSENADKVKDALKSEQAESVSDKVLDGLAGFANKVTGGEHADKIDEIKQKLDGSIGNE